MTEPFENLVAVLRQRKAGPSPDSYTAQLLAAGEDEIVKTGVKLSSGKWYTLGFDWDCRNGTCALTVDGKQVADLSQASEAVGVCYLRVWLSAQKTDEAGLSVKAVDVSARP